MITKTTGFADSNGVVHATIEAAQKAEIEALFKAHDTECNPNAVEGLKWSVTEIADFAVRIAKTQLLDILTTGPKSRPSARKANGGTKKKKTQSSSVSVQ